MGAVARTTASEEPLDPELSICDAHHHLWDRPGSRYLVDELLRDIGGGHRVRSTIHVECVSRYRAAGPTELAPVGETEFAASVAEACLAEPASPAVCAGMVGFADLNLGDRVAAVLDAHLAASARFKGIRHCAAWDASDRIVNAHTQPFAGMLAASPFRRGFSELAKRGLGFDAWVFHPQIPDVTDLARAFPETQIILDHLGGPLGIGPYADDRAGVWRAWKSSLEELARCPNVVVKLGGILMPLNGWGFHRWPLPPTSEQIAAATRDYHLFAIDCFGVDRCMFESNYPADRPSASYTVIWNAFKRIAAGFSAAERRALFHDNAARVYRLGRG